MIRPLVMALVLSMASSASSQTNDALVEAQESFEEGRRLLEAGRLVTGRDLLERSFELAPRAATAFNLALAYRGTGQARRGLALVEQLISGSLGALSQEVETRIVALRDELQNMLAQLVVRTLTAVPITLSVDAGEQVPLAPHDQMTLELDMGTHTLSASAEGHRSRVEHLRLGAGDRRTLVLELEELPEIGMRPGVLVAIIGSSALVIAGAIVGVYFATRPPQVDGDPELGLVQLP